MPWWKLIFALNIGLYIIGIFMTKMAGHETAGGMMGMLGASPEVHLRLGLQTPALLNQGEWWRMLTSTFLHGGIIHIGFNMYFLTQLGPAAEKEFGGWGFLIIYILGGIAGSAVEWWLNEASLGASGSVLAVIGAIAGLGMLRMRKNGFPWERSWDNPLTKEMLKILLIVTVFGIFIGGVAHGAHIGGFVAGAILLFVVEKLSHRKWRKILVGLGGATALLVVGSMTLMAMSSAPKNPQALSDCVRHSVNGLLSPEFEPMESPACLEEDYGELIGEDPQPLLEDLKALYKKQNALTTPAVNPVGIADLSKETADLVDEKYSHIMELLGLHRGSKE